MTRTGIFLCTCDQKINKSVDVDAVANALRGDGRHAVVLLAHACLPDDAAALQRAIVENNLERVVIAACPARFQEKRLRDACIAAGVNPNHFALVDWREGCAWAQRGDKQGATAKALDLVNMGLARVEHTTPLDDVLTKIASRALVIGGGIAGMTAARALADREIQVTLVERESQLGGALRDIPLDGTANAFDTTLRDVLHHPHIELYLHARVVAVKGAVGDYRVEIASASSSNVSEIQVGAVIVATGAREYRDARLYRYDGRRVVTLSEFGIPQSVPRGLSSIAIRNPQSAIVYILCAGARDEHVPYCSNVCCLGALQQAIRVKRANPTVNITILFRDLYLLGDERNEEVVLEARRVGIEFVRYLPAKPPRVEDDCVAVHDAMTHTTRRLGCDQIVLATPLVPRADAGVIARLFHIARDDDGFFPDPHWRLRPEQVAERGVFVCGAAHRPVDVDTAILQGLTAAARAARFIHQREVLRPASSAWVHPELCTGDGHCVETCPVGAIELVAGDSNRADAGRNRPTSVDGQSAQADLAVPSRGFEPPVVDRAVPSRGFELPILDRAVIDPFLCLACGNCVAECPTKAITMPQPSDAQILAQIDAALGGQGNKVLVFGCQWSGIAAMELAGARRMKYPASVRAIELPCSARLDALHVLYALLNGAERVMLAMCPPDECHFGNGNRYAEARIENLRAQLAARGIDPRRLTSARMMGDNAEAWVKAVQ